MVSIQSTQTGTLMRLTPNRSLSWRGNLRILYSLCGLSALIVTGMILAGAWVVLPFVGLELGALAVGLYYTALCCRQQEVVSLDGDTLTIEKGIYRRQTRWQWPRRYTRAWLEVPRHPWTPPAVYLGHRDEEVPLAPFLNHQDTAELVQALEHAGLTVERRQLSP
ncbi:DUF2244 domain-containing protein [Saccharospirillum salsuginis]|uniref:DUF2244 domain-containing protein n=1 Tax=Saccharospirillum salsuginis TaxID=418750 RepID=A0A918KT40_9GAMM|nr:DUF2244 domain-containing protein [Saccharospirillum salsuginis]GGX72334.1 hypothetical protein GCM10007392_44720 [Saccharospirillum salsuginis]